MKTVLFVLLISNTGLITGSWHDMGTPWECEAERKRLTQSMQQYNTPNTLMVTMCAEPFGVKGFDK